MNWRCTTNKSEKEVARFVLLDREIESDWKIVWWRHDMPIFFPCGSMQCLSFLSNWQSVNCTGSGDICHCSRVSVVGYWDLFIEKIWLCVCPRTFINTTATWMPCTAAWCGSWKIFSAAIEQWNSVSVHCGCHSLFLPAQFCCELSPLQLHVSCLSTGTASRVLRTATRTISRKTDATRARNSITHRRIWRWKLFPRCRVRWRSLWKPSRAAGGSAFPTDDTKSNCRLSRRGNHLASVNCGFL